MILVDVFHYGYLELAWKKHDCHHGQESQCRPARVASWHAFEAHENSELGDICSARKKICRPGKKTEGDKNADREKGNQLDQGLECNRRHHTFMAFRCINVPRSKQYRECRQQQRYIERGIFPQRQLIRFIRHHQIGIVLQHDVTRGHGF